MTVELGRAEAWMHELRGPHGRWAREAQIMSANPALRKRRDALGFNAHTYYTTEINGGAHPLDALNIAEAQQARDNAEARWQEAHDQATLRDAYSDDRPTLPGSKIRQELLDDEDTYTDPASADDGGLSWQHRRAVELSWRDAWLHEARGKYGEWVKSDVGSVVRDMRDTAGESAKWNGMAKGHTDSRIIGAVGMAVQGRYHEAADSLDKLADQYASYNRGRGREESQRQELISRLRGHAASLRAIRRADPTYTQSLEDENRRLEDEQFQRQLVETQRAARVQAAKKLPRRDRVYAEDGADVYANIGMPAAQRAISMDYANPLELAGRSGSYRPPRVPGYRPTGAMRKATSASMRKLADTMETRHPDLGSHEHIRDAAKALDRNQHDAAQRHLRAAIENMTPQSLRRHGLLSDDQHDAAKRSMDAVHRHLLLIKDVQELHEQNQQLPYKSDAEGDDGTGDDGLNEKPTARQPGEKALNAPASTNVGRIDINVTKPQQVTGPDTKQVAASNSGDLTTEIELSWDPLRHPRGAHGRFVHAGTPGVGRLYTGGRGQSLTASEIARKLHQMASEAVNPASSKPPRAPRPVKTSGGGNPSAAMLARIKAATGGSDEDWRSAIANYDKAVATRKITFGKEGFADKYPGKAGQEAAIAHFITSKLPGPYTIQAANRQLARRVLELSAKTPALAVTPHPFGKPGGPGLWNQKGMELPPYIQNIAHAILREGRARDLSHAIAIAKASTSKWARTSKHAEVRAASAATNADWEAKRARAHAHANVSAVVRAIELTGTAAGAAKDTHGAAGSPTGGQFVAGSSSSSGPRTTKSGKQPTAHQKHVAHVAHVQNNAAKKSALLKTAAADRAKASQLIKQRNVLMKALASASGKTTKGQAGSTTAKNATTKASTATTAASSTASTSTTAASTAKTPSSAKAATASSSTASATQLRAQIAQLNTQINGLLKAAAAAQAQAMKL